MDRQLNDYLPYSVRSYEDYQGIAAGEQPEFDLAWDAADAALRDQFVTVSGEYGIRRWEQILELTPKGTESLEDRRFRVLTRLNEELPYTLRQLQRMLTTLCGPEGFSVTVPDGEYKVVVRVALTAGSAYGDVQSLLERVVPQNMLLDMSLMYNRHNQFTRYTHQQLHERFTHGQMREEIMQDGNVHP